MNISRRELWQSAKVLLLALFLSVGVPYALAWTGPTAAAPGNNTSAPVNVSATSQTKSGGLWLGSLGTTGGAAIGTTLSTGTKISSPQYCIGTPATSCITAWPSGSASSGVTSIIAGSGISVTGSTGTVTISATPPAASTAAVSGSIVAGCTNDITGGGLGSNTPPASPSCFGGATLTGTLAGGYYAACPAGSTRRGKITTTQVYSAYTYVYTYHGVSLCIKN